MLFAKTDKRTDGQTDGRYQVHYLPRFAVDNYLKHLFGFSFYAMHLASNKD